MKMNLRSFGNFARMLEKSMKKKHRTFGPEFNKILPDRSIIHRICPTVRRISCSLDKYNYSAENKFNPTLMNKVFYYKQKQENKY